ncbi:MAG: glucosaminidase domain-containing protein, partial [Solirubrobacterales bacterium]|nr:glucosaminidase domain-containing protein [Solirubrobacterales bacterium]
TAPAPATPAFGVTTSRGTNVRSRPSSGSRRVARLKQGTRVRVTCQRMAQIAPGRSGRSRIWDRVVLPGGKRAWVADGLLNTGSELLVAKICGDPGYTAAESGATSGRCPVGTPVKLLEPFENAEELIDAALPGARASQKRYRVPVAMTLAQTILETGAGKIAAGANNYFGIKARATGARGVYAWGENASGCVLKKTREAEPDGRLVITIGAFRAYTSLENSILDHGDLLTSNPVYRGAFRYTGDARRFAREIARFYATDPKYALKLLELMKRYKLEQR